MTLREFTFVMKVKAQGFNRRYQEGIKDDPDNFPKEMSEEDWKEQFISYLGW